MKLTSYWLDTSTPFAGGAKGPVEGTCDVAVIGGGLTGSSAALALAKKGARVVLLEADTNRRRRLGPQRRHVQQRLCPGLRHALGQARP